MNNSVLIRVQAELNYIQSKWGKLYNFLKTEKFLELPLEEQELLVLQEEIQQSYITVLKKRLKLLCKSCIKECEEEPSKPCIECEVCDANSVFI